MTNQTFFLSSSSQILQSYFHSFFLQTIQFLAISTQTQEPKFPFYVHIIYIAIPLAVLSDQETIQLLSFPCPALSTYLAIIFTSSGCKSAPVIPNSCFSNKGSCWKNNCAEISDAKVLVENLWKERRNPTNTQTKWHKPFKWICLPLLN